MFKKKTCRIEKKRKLGCGFHQVGTVIEKVCESEKWKGRIFLILYKANLQDWAVFAMCSEKFSLSHNPKVSGCFWRSYTIINSIKIIRIKSFHSGFLFTFGHLCDTWTNTFHHSCPLMSQDHRKGLGIHSLTNLMQESPVCVAYSRCYYLTWVNWYRH